MSWGRYLFAGTVYIIMYTLILGLSQRITAKDTQQLKQSVRTIAQCTYLYLIAVCLSVQLATICYWGMAKIENYI